MTWHWLWWRTHNKRELDEIRRKFDKTRRERPKSTPSRKSKGRACALSLCGRSELFLCRALPALGWESKWAQLRNCSIDPYAWGWWGGCRHWLHWSEVVNFFRPSDHGIGQEMRKKQASEMMIFHKLSLRQTQCLLSLFFSLSLENTPRLGLRR